MSLRKLPTRFNRRTDGAASPNRGEHRDGVTQCALRLDHYPDLAWFLGPSNSHKKTPCHVPNWICLSTMSSVALCPIMLDFTWAAVFPSPCRLGDFHGTACSKRNHVRNNVRSAFSF